MDKVSFLPGWLEVLHKLSSFISDRFLTKAGLKKKSKFQLFVKRGIIYSTQVLDLVNEDEGLPAKSSHAQCLTLWQLSSNPRQERRYLMMVDIAVSSKREETERRFNAIIFLPGKGWWPSCLCFAQPT